jgi:hypothetical protein
MQLVHTKEQNNAARRKAFVFCAFCFGIIITFFIAAGLYYLFSSPILAKEPVTINYGDPFPEAAAWFTRNGETAAVTNAETLTNLLPGTYAVHLSCMKKTFNTMFVVNDGEAPKAEPITAVLKVGSSPAPEEFYRGLTDVSPVSAAFVTQPVTSAPGVRDVSVLLTDSYKNKTTLTATCVVLDIANVVTVERGVKSTLSVGDFVPNPGTQELAVNSAPTTEELAACGTYPATLSYQGKSIEVSVKVVDTSYPVATARSVTIWQGEKVEASAFVKLADESDAVSVVFDGEPEWNKIGDQTVSVIVTDSAGNAVTIKGTLSILADTTPPTITGAKDLRVMLQDKVTYRSGVTVKDDQSEATLTIDSSKVNTGVAGTYPVTYTATDLAGNTSSVKITVTVLTLNTSVVNQMVDKALASLKLDGLTDDQKAYKICSYVRRLITYVNTSEHRSVYETAYSALKYRKGDCWSYYSVSELMLTRAGIENMMITRVGGRQHHWWSLIKIDGKWYHYDSTPYRGSTADMHRFTTKTAEYYTKKTSRNYTFDSKLYPEIVYDEGVST